MERLKPHSPAPATMQVLGGRRLGFDPNAQVKYALDLSGRPNLRTLPAGLAVPVLILDDCSGLTTLPEGIDVVDLSMRNCVAFEHWPRWMHGDLARLDLHGCVSLRSLSDELTSVVHLDLSGCIELATLPEHLVVSGSIDLADTQISRLPPGVAEASVKWRGIPVPARVALQPETITMNEVVAEDNAERRRVLIERMGYDRFIAESDATVRDQDVDPGGARALLHVALQGQEDLVCLSVQCPSTGDRYMLRVPPATWTCHDAAAWIAGFDDPDEYRPRLET